MSKGCDECPVYKKVFRYVPYESEPCPLCTRTPDIWELESLDNWLQQNMDEQDI